jgi:hypothetical protein
VRYRAILATPLYHGMRREELSRLRVDDLQSELKQFSPWTFGRSEMQTKRGGHLTAMAILLALVAIEDVLEPFGRRGLSILGGVDRPRRTSLSGNRILPEIGDERGCVRPLWDR